jgi:hypothetical protein
MKPVPVPVFLAALGLAMLGLGCGNTVKDVCEDLSDQCDDVVQRDCLADGNKLQSTAESRNCDDKFDAYLDCVADAGCLWGNACENQRVALEACTGKFP